MVLNKENAKIINTKEIYLHDDIMLSMDFDRISKVLKVKFQSYSNKDNFYMLNFINTIGFEMTACDFWGASECILDFEYICCEERIIISAMQEKWIDTTDVRFEFPYSDYIETLFTFSSGDSLRIACECIEVIQ